LYGQAEQQINAQASVWVVVVTNKAQKPTSNRDANKVLADLESVCTARLLWNGTM